MRLSRLRAAGRRRLARLGLAGSRPPRALALRARDARVDPLVLKFDALEHWSPGTGLWVGGALGRGLLEVARGRGRLDPPGALRGPDRTSSRWFHPNISGVEAEKLLLSRGQHGSFLVRPSKSCPGSFTLSVRRHNEVAHINVQNTGDYYDLYGGEKFATLAKLVHHYTGQRGGLLRECSGAPVALQQPLGYQDPVSEWAPPQPPPPWVRWYHGHLSGKEAEQLLMEKGRLGTFLVRESRSHPGDFVLSVLTPRPEKADLQPRVTHVMIHFQMGSMTWEVGSSSTPSLTWWSTAGRTPWWRSRGRWCSSSSPSKPRGSTPQASRAECKSSADPLMPAGRPSRASGKNLRCCSSRDVGSCTPGRRGRGWRTCPRIATRTSFPVRARQGPCRGDRALSRAGPIWQAGAPGRWRQGVVPLHWCDFSFSLSGPLPPSSRSPRGPQAKRWVRSLLPSISPGDLSSSFPFPVDTTCVTLRDVDDTVPGADYINANSVRSDPEKTGHGPGKVYIATQGCLQSTVAAFWAMVHQENTRVIVMATREVERGRSTKPRATACGNCRCGGQIRRSRGAQ
ncbi:uncharacterized protein LOC116568258 [Mustela erminea]|uniref:uncharacterized protein LOC116568258 n=1 Tax=Mustela erminea TaxID=36723 RepID=UPI0013866D2F|nr:uncharacterized protein LOC116568258 [Mustela erminea]